MWRPGTFVMLGCLVAGAVAAAERGSDKDTEVRRSMVLAADEKMDIHPLTLERATLHEVTSGSAHFAVRAAPGGLVEVRPTDVAVNVWILGPAGGTTAFTLRAGERVAFWPIRKLEVHAKPGSFALMAIAADTAFVLRADRTLASGLRVKCDGTSCSLSQGQRLDVSREDGKTRPRVIGPAWPGDVVQETDPPPAEPEESPAEPEPIVTTAPAEETLGDIGLPVIAAGLEAWEVTAAQPASP